MCKLHIPRKYFLSFDIERIIFLIINNKMNKYFTIISTTEIHVPAQKLRQRVLPFLD